MRSARNFSPEWGYLAPTPSFARTTRLVLVATAIGATAGAAAAPAASATPITAAVAVPVPASAPVVASAPPQEKPEAPRQATGVTMSAATVFTGIAAAGAHAIH